MLLLRYHSDHTTELRCVPLRIYNNAISGKCLGSGFTQISFSLRSNELRLSQMLYEIGFSLNDKSTNMNFKYLSKLDKIKIEKLFTSAFTSSEGEQEGRLIGQLSAKLSEDINDQDIFCFGVFIKEDLVGSIFFTQLYFDTKIKVYMLAPVAVSPQHQQKGIGSSLIKFGINELKNKAVDIIITYGDPAFYSKVGFQKITEDIIKAPLKLSMPKGWLGQSLREKSILDIKDRPSCVKAFDNPAYW